MTNGEGQEFTFQANNFTISTTSDGDEAYEEGPYGPIWVPNRMSLDIGFVINDYPQWISDMTQESSNERNLSRNISLKLFDQNSNVYNVERCSLTNVSIEQSSNFSIETSLKFISWHISVNTQTQVEPQSPKLKSQMPKIDWRKEGF